MKRKYNPPEIYINEGFYGGRQYFNGTFGFPGMLHPEVQRQQEAKRREAREERK